MRSLLLLALALVGACALPAPPPPLAEFLVSAGDQTYWVQSNHLGLKIRGSPLILARTGGRYYEVYIGEVDRSYPRALFAAERVFRLPARHDLPVGRMPAWVAGVEREMKVEPMDWPLLAREGAAWMGYWDQQVRNTGKN